MHRSLEKRVTALTPVRQTRLSVDSPAHAGRRADAPLLLIASTSSERSQTLATVVDRLPVRVVLARGLAHALEVTRAEQVDLVIADMAMPADAAIELCRVVRNSSSAAMLPLLLIGQSGSEEEEVRALDAGADSFLPKLAHTRALRASVESLLRRRTALAAQDESETILFTLAQSVEERDPALGQHCGRLARMAAAMGVALGLSASDVLTLQRGGYLHDVGKIAIPDSVLFKKGPLTADEWLIMKSHPERGERICRAVRSLEPVLPLIRHHHERWDGEGYPDKLRGDEIPMLARIIQFADIYDALTTARPYKDAFSPQEALRIMWEETRKGWRDPKLMQVFADLLPVFEEPAFLETSELSLPALATTLEGFQRRAHGTETASPRQPIRMVSGL